MQDDRTGPVEERHAAGDAADDAAVGAGAVGEEGRPRREVRDAVVDVRIRGELDAAGGKRPLDLQRENLPLDAEHGALPPDEQEAQKHRCARDVAAAEVQCPRDLVERGEQERVRVLRGHVAAQQRELFLAREPRERGVQLPDRLSGERRAVRPDLAYEVAVRGEADLPRRERLFQPARERGAHGAPVKAERAAARQVFGEKIGDGRHAGLPLAHELDGAARELLPGLQEVAPIRPERGALRQHDERSRRAGEAREPRTRLEEAAHIFRAVEVTGCDDVAVHPGIAQLFAQGGELFGGLHKIQRPFPGNITGRDRPLPCR